MNDPAPSADVIEATREKTIACNDGCNGRRHSFSINLAKSPSDSTLCTLGGYADLLLLAWYSLILLRLDAMIDRSGLLQVIASLVVVVYPRGLK